MKAKRFNRLSALMTEYGITNAMLASHIKRSTDSISLWRQNKSQPSLPMIFTIAEYFKVPPSTLLVSVTWPEGPSLAEKALEDMEKRKAQLKKSARRKNTK